MMTWLAFGGAAFRGAAFAFGALTATSTRTASELDAAPTASMTTVGTLFLGFAFALALFRSTQPAPLHMIPATEDNDSKRR
ncbi:MAG: hypothetical protein ACKPKO_28960, partial [Candidatus Fonsibacter sp.]